MKVDEATLSTELTPLHGVGGERSSCSGHPPSVWGDLQRRIDISSRSIPKPPTNKWLNLLFGQLIALLASSQNAASFYLEYGMGKVFPFFLMFHTYAFMSIHLWFAPTVSHEDTTSYHIPMTRIRLRTPWWYYLCLCILDVTPNYLTLLSLKNTSLPSSTLLSSLTAPSIMVSCHILLRKHYRPAHFLGVALCLTAGTMTMWTDLATSSSGSEGPNLHPHSYYGDFLALIAAILYGIGDAVGEFWCKHVDRKEYLGMLGFGGTFFCGLLVLLTERDSVVDLFRDKDSLYPALGVMAIYVPILVLYYVSASVFLVSSDATLLNLSLQSSNMWAICFSIVAFQEAPSSLFYLALVLEISGVFVYELLGNSGTTTSQEGTSGYPKRSHKVTKDLAPIS